MIPTYKRGELLRYSLESLSKQTKKPDEVIIILKPSYDKSEQIIKEFNDVLFIKLIIQNSGGFVQAVALGIKYATNEIILFMDDDAIAKHNWIERYISLFYEIRDAGAIGGLIYKSYIINHKPVLIDENFDSYIPTSTIRYRKPLKEFEEYCGWIAKAGIIGRGMCTEKIIKDVQLRGANMGFRSDLIRDCPLDQAYRRSIKGLFNESFLAYCARKKGYHIYRVLDPSKSPIVYHIMDITSLTRGHGFWHEFWMHYDRASMYWRLRNLGAEVSLLDYLLAMAALARRRTLPRLLATLYAIATR